MASATVESKAIADPYAPANIAEYEADKTKRKADQDARRPEMRRCLDPEYAARKEARKPLYEWEVECTYSRQDDKGRMVTKSPKEKVIAQNEADAWALFCDKIGDYPSPLDSDRTFKRLDKIN